MAILQGIKLKNDETVHQLDWEKGIANKPKPIQSDYSQNDETALDFIKNRPFHDNLDGREIIVKKQNLALTENDKSNGSNPMDYCYLQFNVASNPLGLRFIEGEKLIYIWGDTEYECETKYEYDETDEVGIYRIGNQNIMYSDAEDTGEPFLIAKLEADENYLIQISSRSNSATLEIQKDIKTVKYLDSKYIKDMYSEVNKIEEILPLQTLELSLEGTEEYGTYIPVTMDYQIKIGDYMTVTYEGIEYNCEIFDFAQAVGVGFEVPVIGNALGESTEPFCMIFDTTGALSGEGQVIVIMVTTPPQEGVEAITREVGIKYNVHKINYINPKYIKDIYHAEDGEYETVIESHEVEFEYDESDEVYYGDLPVTVFEAGKKYKIIVDGTEYVSVCRDGTIPLIAGNLAIMYGYSNDIVNSTTIMTNEEGTTHTIAIEVQGDEIIYHVPNKYIKDMYGAEINKILESQDLSFIYTEEEGCITMLSLVGAIEGNKKYIITFDGVEYECLSKEFSQQIGLGYVLGTDEPFCIIVEKNTNVVGMITKETVDTTHTVAIREETVHQVPSKYVNAYTKEEIDTMFGTYVEEVNTLLGGE